jgi:D-glycero-D-manno-heptose 1,7-bisphosphate phosphatase
MSRKALFLDRDGVINVNHGYVATRERTDFIEGIFDLCRLAHDRGYMTVVVTNQAGIARGYYSEDEFKAYMHWMEKEFERHGSMLDAVYYCPHHPSVGRGAYLQVCDCRKPAPGMLLRAASELDIALADSVLVGDKPSDMEAGRRAGIKTRVLFGHARHAPDATCEIAHLAALTDCL